MLVLAAWAGPGTGAGAAEADAVGDARALEARRQELRSRVAAVQRELAAAETSRADAADALQTSALAISDANRRLHDLAAERRKIVAALAKLDAERSALAVQVRGEQTLLARLLARQQRGSEHDWLKLLLSGRDPGDISRLLHYYRAISEARARSIAGLRANQQRAQALADEALARQQRLDALAQDEQAQRSLLEQGRRQQAQVLARVAADIRRQQRELDRLQRDEARLARLLDRLAEFARSRPPPDRPPDRPPEAATAPPRATACAAAARRCRSGGNLPPASVPQETVERQPGRVGSSAARPARRCVPSPPVRSSTPTGCAASATC
ncbi:MAG: hypothetical protein IPO82_10465 [Betaproteobacteria bacterium]|nr:hypothetical protein [Betaproteobacteria bacterium]